MGQPKKEQVESNRPPQFEPNLSRTGNQLPDRLGISQREQRGNQGENVPVTPIPPEPHEHKTGK